MSAVNAKRAGIYGVVVVLASPVAVYFEGLNVRAHLDPIGIVSICYGETEGVKMGDVKTKEECDKMLTARLGYFAWRVDAMVTPPMNPYTHAALTSWAYNVGVGAAAKSTLIRKMNAGDVAGACNELRRWVFAGGKKWNGLVKRREAERKLCLRGANV